MMTFRNILIMALCMVLVTSLDAKVRSNAKVRNNIVQDSLFQIPKTAIVPVIDGICDPIWQGVPETHLRNFDATGTPPDPTPLDPNQDLDGYIRLMYDDNNVYGFMYTQDDTLWDQDGTSWTNDGWEVYFDADYSHVAPYDANDYQIRFEHKDLVADDLDGSSSFTVKDGIEFVNLDALHGYILEFKIPWADIQVTPEEGKWLGFEAQQNDNDGQGRTHISKWWWMQPTDISWTNPDSWGTAILKGTVDTICQIHKTSTAPTIDGVMEDLWLQKTTLYTLNNYNATGTLPDDYVDLSGSFRLMWDETNVYGFMMTKDDTLWDQDGTSWTNDGWEVYFDADYSHVAPYDANDYQIRFEHKDLVSDDLDGSSSFTVKDGIEFVNVDVDGGYNLEFKIPWADIQVTPAEGTLLGFEAQQNDNDGQGRTHISKWWWMQPTDISWTNPDSWGTAKLVAEIPTGVAKQSAQVANRFALSQNYPNPFNPTTQIAFELPKSEKVRLAVYNLLGEQVAVLVNGMRNAGPQSVTFNADNLASGIYFYRLEAGSNVSAKKMMLIK